MSALSMSITVGTGTQVEVEPLSLGLTYSLLRRRFPAVHENHLHNLIYGTYLRRQERSLLLTLTEIATIAANNNWGQTKHRVENRYRHLAPRINPKPEPTPEPTPSVNL